MVVVHVFSIILYNTKSWSCNTDKLSCNLRMLSSVNGLQLCIFFIFCLAIRSNLLVGITVEKKKLVYMSWDFARMYYWIYLLSINKNWTNRFMITPHSYMSIPHVSSHNTSMLLEVMFFHFVQLCSQNFVLMHILQKLPPDTYPCKKT
jgi:hypothetical protein